MRACLLVRLMPPGSLSASSRSTPLACPDLLRGVVTPVPTTLGVCRPAAAQDSVQVSPGQQKAGMCAPTLSNTGPDAICQNLYDSILQECIGSGSQSNTRSTHIRSETVHNQTLHG